MKGPIKKFLKCVTVTGADDTTSISDVLTVTKQFPYVEWGILLSKNSSGRHRFPSIEWMETLCHTTQKADIRLSGHICGCWVRDICKGDWTILEELPWILDMFKRFQINFHAEIHHLDIATFLQGLRNPKFKDKQFIFQLDDVNNAIFNIATDNGIDAVPLFDISGGRGISPESWPEPKAQLNGYAGGFCPGNVDINLMKISKVIGDKDAWIDAETCLFTQDNNLQCGYCFDMNKINSFLKTTRSWVID